MSETKTANCARCGKTMAIKPKGRPKKYCSRTCTRGLVKLGPIRCANCDGMFQPKQYSRRDTVCCSPACSNAWQYKLRMAKKTAAKPKIKCAHCGSKFTPRAVNGVYCSKACQNVGKNAKARAEARERMSKTRHCEHCGDEYLPVRAHQRYCHSKCKDNAKRAKLLAAGICTSCKSRKAAPGFTECWPCKEKRETNRNAPRDWAYYYLQDKERVAKRKAQIEMEKGYSLFLCRWTSSLNIADATPWKRELPLPDKRASQ